MLCNIRITHLENVLRFSKAQQRNTQSQSAATPAAGRGATRELGQSVSRFLIHQSEPEISLVVLQSNFSQNWRRNPPVPDICAVGTKILLITLQLKCYRFIAFLT